jgi:nucleotide-binding universal stress UspA family protein
MSGTIVVGVDGSPGSRAALRWALWQAAHTGQTVRAVRAWSYPASFEWTLWSSNYGPVPVPALPDRQDVQDAADHSLAELVAELAGPEGPVRVEHQVVEGHPAGVLLDAAKDADLLVIGRHGHGGFVGMMLGSVSRHCVEHAGCPVLVMPPEDSADEEAPR